MPLDALSLCARTDAQLVVPCEASVAKTFKVFFLYLSGSEHCQWLPLNVFLHLFLFLFRFSQGLPCPVSVDQTSVKRDLL